MKTTIYFVRHVSVDYSNHDDYSRDIDEQGKKDVLVIKEIFKNIKLSAAYSSPLLRAKKTIALVASDKNLVINEDESLKERVVCDYWLEDFSSFAKRQWSDFDYKLDGGESLNEVQNRNIKVIKKILLTHPGENIIVATHGTALSTILNYYDRKFGYQEFKNMTLPAIYEVVFDGEECCSIKEIYDFSKKCENLS